MSPVKVPYGKWDRSFPSVLSMPEKSTHSIATRQAKTAYLSQLGKEARARAQLSRQRPSAVSKLNQLFSSTFSLPRQPRFFHILTAHRSRFVFLEQPATRIFFSNHGRRHFFELCAAPPRSTTKRSDRRLDSGTTRKTRTDPSQIHRESSCTVFRRLDLSSEFLWLLTVKVFLSRWPWRWCYSGGKSIAIPYPPRFQ
jgi:hypothetical protein